MYRNDGENEQMIYIADAPENIASLCSELTDYGFDVYDNSEGIIVRSADYDIENITDLLDEYGTFYSLQSRDDALCMQKCGIVKNLLEEIDIGIVNVGNGEYCLCDFDAICNGGSFLLDDEPVKYSSLPEILDNEIVKDRIAESVLQLLKQELEQENYEISDDDFPETAVQWQNKIFASYDYNVFKQDKPEADILTRIIANRVELPLEELTADNVSREQVVQLINAVNREPDIKMSRTDNDIIKANERA